MAKKNSPTKKATKTVTKRDINEQIKTLEKERSSKVIVYITGDRNPAQHLGTVIASDTIPKFKQILKSIGKTKKITLALYTNGGNLEAPWPLVSMIREHCDTFEVIVLEKALSAGTLVALGADRIVMTPFSSLSPIDPAAQLQDQNKNLKKIEIEDVIGYLDFVKEKIGITEQTALSEITKDLTKEIPPSLLGSVNRTHALIRRLAKNLLKLHKKRIPERQLKDIVEHLTQKLFSHRHLINRNEAREIGFEDIIDCPTQVTENKIEGFMDFYTKYLKLDEDFDPLTELGSDAKKDITISRAIIHSSKEKYDFQSRYTLLKGKNENGQEQIALNNTGNKWLKI